MAVAHRMYARALFEAAKERESLARVREELGDFVDTERDVPALRELMRSPQLDPQAKIAALEGLLGDSDELVRNFLRLLIVKGRGAELEHIVEELDQLAAAEERRLSVELTTAYELSDEEAASILRKIEAASGRSVEATRKVDPSLLGGVVLQAGSLRVDASVRGRFERLRQQLAQR